MLNPYVRVLARALLAGLGAFLTSYQRDGDLVPAVVAGAIVAVGLASAELLTPINATVGVAKGT